MNLVELRAANQARDAEWVSPGAKLSLSFRGNELAGEIGEACNVIKKLERERLGLVGSRATIDDLAEELSDGVICIDLIAMDLGIDLGRAIASKFNATSQKRGLATILSPSRALADVVAERRRQVEAEGWTAKHDDEHTDGEIGRAAAAYALSAMKLYQIPMDLARDMKRIVAAIFPWEAGAFKPSGKPNAVRRCLVKAAALIIAEIERLDRKAESAPSVSEEREP